MLCACPDSVTRQAFIFCRSFKEILFIYLFIVLGFKPLVCPVNAVPVTNPLSPFYKPSYYLLPSPEFSHSALRREHMRSHCFLDPSHIPTPTNLFFILNNNNHHHHQAG